MPRERQRRCAPVTLEIADEIRRAIQLAGSYGRTERLGLSRANFALFMLGDPSIPPEKLPKVNSKPMRWLIEGLSSAADEAREDGKEELADNILAAMERIDPSAAAWWREVGQAQREAYQERMAQRDAPAALKRHTVYEQGFEFFAIDSHGDEIVRLRANQEERDDEDRDDDDEDGAGEEWKRGVPDQ